MKNAIIACASANIGDFLINHWLKSLKENVNLSNIDIIILDYGLTKEQAKKLKDNRVIIKKGTKTGFPNSAKFGDIKKFLSAKDYDQVLTCDSSDIIFQSDISHLFDEDKSGFRCICENVVTLFKLIIDFEFTLSRSFNKNDLEKIKKVIKGKKIANAGFILAPCRLFRQLCVECESLIKNNSYGPDQIAINYVLYRDGFKELDPKYNFLVLLKPFPFYIKKGEFYSKNGEKIPVVHNGGWKKFFRPVKNFGYGSSFNQLKKTYSISKIFIKLLNMFRW